MTDIKQLMLTAVLRGKLNIDFGANLELCDSNPARA